MTKYQVGDILEINYGTESCPWHMLITKIDDKMYHFIYLKSGESNSAAIKALDKSHYARLHA